MVGPSAKDYRSKLIRIFTFLGGIYFFLHFVLPESTLTSMGWQANHEAISNGFIVVGAMALGLGIFNIVRTHGARCVFKRPGWVNSLALLSGLVAMVGVTSAQWIQGLKTSSDVRAVRLTGDFATRIVSDAEGQGALRGVPALEERVKALIRHEQDQSALVQSEIVRAQDSGPLASVGILSSEAQGKLDILNGDIRELSTVSWESLGSQQKALLKKVAQDGAMLASAYALVRRSNHSGTWVHTLYTFLYDGLFNQLGSAMFALLGVYIGAAAYRAFRVRSFESGLMMATAVVVMLGQISLGGSHAVSESISLQDVRQWLLEVPNSAAFRAIRLGAGVAGLMLAIRMWLSIESGSFSSKER